MNLAIHTSAYSEVPLPKALSRIVHTGYEAIEIAADISESRHFEAHSATKDDVANLRRLLTNHDLKLAAVDIGGWDPELCIANLDETARTSAVRNVEHAISVTGDLGCRLVTAHLWGLPAEGSRERAGEFRDPFLRSLSELADALDRSDVQLNFMPHPGGFEETSDGTVNLVREAKNPHIGYTFGTSHAFVINGPNQTPADMIRYAGDTLTHVLVSDTHDVQRIIAPPEVKAHEHMVPGSGDIDFRSILDALCEIDYNGALCVHLISERDRIDDASRRAKQIADQWMG